MNPQDIHQRDVTAILTNLQTELDNIKGDIEKNPEEAEKLKNQISKLLEDAERDLRLKTQAINRSNLSQSRVLPVNLPTSAELRKDPISFKELIQKPSPKTRPKTTITRVETPRMPKSPKVKLPSRNVSNVRQPASNRPPTVVNNQIRTETIQPLAFTQGRNRDYRPQTQIVTTRTRKIPDLITHLHPVDRHDPGATPPPIADYDVDKFGVQRLVDTGYIKKNNIQSQLDGFLTVSKYVGDMTQIPVDPMNTFVLDDSPETSPLFDIDYTQPLNLIPPNNQEDSTKQAKSRRLTFLLVNAEPLQSADYFAFRRAYASQWEQMTTLLGIVKHYCENNGITRQTIDCERFAELAKYDLDEISDSKLIRCFLDPIDTTKKRKRVIKLTGPDAEHNAAILIQSVWRGFIARRQIRSIMRVNAAARMIQRQFRTCIIVKKFKDKLQKDHNNLISKYEAKNLDQTANSFDVPHVQVHFVNSHNASELGRLSYLANKNTTLVLYMHSSLPTEVTSLITKYTENDLNLHIMPTHFNLPDSVALEEIFSMDIPALNRIRTIANKHPIFIFPQMNKISLMDAAQKLGADIMCPSPNKYAMFDTRQSILRLLNQAGLKTFETSERIYEKAVLMKVITQLCMSLPKIINWRLRTAEGDTAWYGSNDFTLIDQLIANKNVLTQEDMEDPNFIGLLQQSITNDLPKNLNMTTNYNSYETFVRKFLSSGGTVEALPLTTKSYINASFFVPRLGSPQILGTWETVYVSAFEPFASIHPAFSVPKDRLKKRVMKIAGQCSVKRLLGVNTVKFFYGTHVNYKVETDEDPNYKMKFIADDLILGQVEPLLPQLMSEMAAKSKFDTESMSIGPSTFTYAQPLLELPEEVDFTEFREKLIENDIMVDTKVFIFPHLKRKDAVGMVCVEQNIERLISVVFRVMTVISTQIFNIEADSDAKLVCYMKAISYLKGQLDSSGEIQSTTLAGKMAALQIPKKSSLRMFRFDSLVMKDPQDSI